MTSSSKPDQLAAPKPQSEDEKKSVVAISAGIVSHVTRIVRFRGRPMVLQREPYPHYEPLHRDMFDTLAYPLLGGVSRSRMGDVFAYLGNTVEDLTSDDHHILFGLEDRDRRFAHDRAETVVWDMDALEFVDGFDPARAVWRSPYGQVPPRASGSGDPDRLPFIMSLAGGDSGLYDDIMQSLAPLVMRRKPDGVIWWVGDGANGKSTLMDAIYRIFPGQLSSITVKRLTDGRDTPSLNGTLANVVKESSEGRIDDTEIYKAIGTHENFRVHKFHSQDDIEVRGNIHHIFSGNSVPTFNDKGWSARRRTFIVPFGQRFESDPNFEDVTFTPLMFGRLIAEMCRYAKQLERQGLKYKWSAATLAAKADYDTDANNAEEYAKHIIEEGVVGYDNFTPVKIDYDNWCADNGYVPLGITNLRRALQSLGFERISVRIGDRTSKVYRLPGIASQVLSPLGIGRPGLYSTPGFTPELPPEEKPVPEFNEQELDEPVEPQKKVLKGTW